MEQLLYYLSITELAAGVDQRSDCGIALQLYCTRQILDLPRPRDKPPGPESFRVGHRYGRREAVTASVTRKSDPPPDVRSDAAKTTCRQNGGGPTISHRWRRYAALTSSEVNDS